MFRDIVCVLFIVGMIAQEVIRFPHRMRNKRERQAGQMVDSRLQAGEIAVSFFGFLGTEIIPLIYFFGHLLDFADYSRPATLGWLGLLPMLGSLYLLWRAHADLGHSWSPTLEVSQGQSLVTKGVYGVIRHPIYAAFWLMSLAQVLMLSNWIAGPAGLISALLLTVIRIPLEEQMMLDHFGDAYRAYMGRVGGIVPRLFH